MMCESTQTDVVVESRGTNTRQIKKLKTADRPTASIRETDKSQPATKTDATSTQQLKHQLKLEKKEISTTKGPQNSA